MSDERRRFFRIDDVIHLKTEVVDRQQLDQRLMEFQDNRHPYAALNKFNYQLEQHQSDLKRIKDRLPEVGRYLEVLQKQLDLLTDRILDDDSDFVERKAEVSLSAQGIAFYADESVQPGDVLELHIKLMPEKHRLVIFARVIKCEKSANKSDRYRISLDFEHIHDADRELLVKHVHGKQLRALGAARFGEDNE